MFDSTGTVLYNSSVSYSVRAAIVVLHIENGVPELLALVQSNTSSLWELPGGEIRTDVDISSESALRRILRSDLQLTPEHVIPAGVTDGRNTASRGGWGATAQYIVPVSRQMLDRAIDDNILRNIKTDLIRFPNIKTQQECQVLTPNHRTILAHCASTFSEKSRNSVLPALLLEKEFTILQLRHAFEAALREPLDPANFRRKISELDIIVKTDAIKREKTPQRPAHLYRLK